MEMMGVLEEARDRRGEAPRLSLLLLLLEERMAAAAETAATLES